MAAPRLALSIAGSDPTGGAGLQLDLRVFEHFGVHGMAVPTALTIQSTARVRQVLPVFPGVMRDQLRELLADLSPHAIKLGMLATDDVVLRVADALPAAPIPRVLDPVLRASDGTVLTERRALRNLIERILCGAALVTPNLDEAELLTGTREPEAAARILLEMGAQAALIKGGHAQAEANDFLHSASERCWLPGTRSGVGPVHGTGCALSAAITARLAQGAALGDAVRTAKAFVTGAIEHSFAPGRGQRLLAWRSATGAHPELRSPGST